jgi:hypothetical protein
MSLNLLSLYSETNYFFPDPISKNYDKYFILMASESVAELFLY